VARRLLLPLLLVGLASAAAGGAPLATRQLFLAGVPFELEVAADPASRERGLMGRAEVDPRGGMLFVFPDEAPRTFWMRDCLVDIDIAFLDARGRVTASYTMRAEPPQGKEESEARYFARLRQYPSLAPARYAVELRAGTLARLGLRAGGSVDVTGIPLTSQ
jgi:uncharacterized membrane protein (UPF0127 family)